MMPWTTDRNGLGRRSTYEDRAVKPPVRIKKGMGFSERRLDLTGDLHFLLSRAGEIEYVDCGASLTFGEEDSVTATIGGLGVVVGAARSRSRAITFASFPCSTCVPILELTNARLVQDWYYTRGGKLKTVSNFGDVTPEPGCQTHFLIDCTAKPDCPGCHGDPYIPSNLSVMADNDQASHGPAGTFTVVSFDSTHEIESKLLSDCREWLMSAIDFETVNAAGGLYVNEPWKGAVPVPLELSQAPPGIMPASLISIGMDSQPWNAVLVDREEACSVVMLAPSSDSITGRARIVPESAYDQDETVDFVQLDVTQLDSLCIVGGIVPPVGESLENGRLQILISDEATGRERDLQIPIIDLGESTLAGIDG